MESPDRKDAHPIWGLSYIEFRHLIVLNDEDVGCVGA